MNDDGNEEKYFEVALKEIETNNLSKGLWAKALANTEGDKDKARAFYLKERAAQLSKFHQKKISENEGKRVKENDDSINKKTISSQKEDGQLFRIYMYKDLIKTVKIVKDGFSWFAFLFSPLWALVNGLFLALFVYVVFYWCIEFLGYMCLQVYPDLKWIINYSIFSAYCIVGVIFGLYGNQWRFNKLVKNGYKWKCTLKAPNSTLAQQRYLQDYQINTIDKQA